MIGRPNTADFVFHHQESFPESTARESSEIKRKKRRQYEEKSEKMRASKLQQKNDARRQFHRPRDLFYVRTRRIRK